MTLQISNQHIDEAMESLAKPFFEKLEKLHGSAKNGVNVPGYSEEELKAMAVTLKFASSCGAGAVSYEDESGVRYHVFRGSGDVASGVEINDKPATLILSHMDKASYGSHYAGRASAAAGLCTAFAVAAHHKANGTQMDRPLVVAEFPCAESLEFSCYALGSKIATQQLPHEFITTQTAQSDGQSLFQRMNDIGMNAAKICENLAVGNKTLPTEHICAAYEFQIAQSGHKAYAGLHSDATVLAQKDVPAFTIRGKTRDADPFKAGAAFYDAVVALSYAALNDLSTDRDNTPDGKSFEQALIERGAMPF